MSCAGGVLGLSIIKQQPQYILPQIIPISMHDWRALMADGHFVFGL